MHRRFTNNLLNWITSINIYFVLVTVLSADESLSENVEIKLFVGISSDRSKDFYILSDHDTILLLNFVDLNSYFAKLYLLYVGQRNNINECHQQNNVYLHVQIIYKDLKYRFKTEEDQRQNLGILLMLHL